MPAGKPVIEVPGAAEDFFNQADDPHGFFDSLPEQPSGDAAAAAAAAAGGMSSGGAAGLSNGGVISEPATPMADANHVQEGTERVRCSCSFLCLVNLVSAFCFQLFSGGWVLSCTRWTQDPAAFCTYDVCTLAMGAAAASAQAPFPTA
jgi:hypothetical protein